MSESKMHSPKTPSGDSQLGMYFTDSVPTNDLSTKAGIYDLAGKNVNGVYDLSSEIRYKWYIKMKLSCTIGDLINLAGQKK